MYAADSGRGKIKLICVKVILIECCISVSYWTVIYDCST